MGTTTPNLSLYKTDPSELVDPVTAINENLDKIDVAFGELGGGGGGSPIATVAASNTDPDYAATAQFVCDGEDDQVEINEAINSSNAGDGSIVLLLPGTFYLTDSIYPTGLLVGSGQYATKLRWQAAVAGGSMLLPGTGGLHVAHMTLQADTAGTCLDGTGGGNCLYDHLSFVSQHPLVSTVKLSANDILRDSWLSSWGIGVEVNNQGGVHIDHNVILAYKAGIILYDSPQCYVTHNTVGGGGSGDDTTMPGEFSFYTMAAGAGIVLIDSDEDIILGNRVDAVPGHGILLYNAAGNQVAVNFVHSFGQRQPGVHTYSGIHLTDDSNDNTIQGNRVRASTFINSVYGIRVEPACYDNFVAGNDLAFAAGQGSPNPANNFSDAGVGTITTSENRSGINTVNRQAANYALALGDAGKVVEMNVAGANTLTVPTNATVAFPVGTMIEVMQYGAGQTTLTPAGGVTLRSPGGKLKIAAQYGAASLRKIATDEWAVEGNLAS